MSLKALVMNSLIESMRGHIQKIPGEVFFKKTEDVYTGKHQYGDLDNHRKGISHSRFTYCVDD